MLFSSLIFLIVFLPSVLFVYYLPLRKHRSAQNVFLLLASLAFYAWGEPWFVAVMMLSIAANWLFGLLADRYRGRKAAGRAVITAMLVFNLSIMFVFKYLMFVLGVVNSISGAGLRIPEIALPIGISFFTFQAISYVVDVYRGNGEVQKNLLNVGLYIAFFPQLIAGPIVRYRTIASQIRDRNESFSGFSEGVCRFIVGLSKKILIANNCAIVANHAFYQVPAGFGSLSLAWLGAIAYTLQIYYDFSGYSDMAIGLGKMFGFEFSENFNYPYISRSVSEFWRRWHISLGSWFRDYVYFPLGGSRVDSKLRLVFNLFVVWFLTGLWHGANWTFILWGLMYFALITAEKLLDFDKRRIPGALRRVYTLFFVVLGWVLFRSNDLASASAYIKAMFGVESLRPLVDWSFGMYFKDYFIWLFFGFIFSAPLLKALGELLGRKFGENRPFIEIPRAALLLCGLLLCLAFLMKGVYNPFIYFNF